MKLSWNHSLLVGFVRQQREISSLLKIYAWWFHQTETWSFVQIMRSSLTKHKHTWQHSETKLRWNSVRKSDLSERWLEGWLNLPAVLANYFLACIKQLKQPWRWHSWDIQNIFLMLDFHPSLKLMQSRRCISKFNAGISELCLDHHWLHWLDIQTLSEA